MKTIFLGALLGLSPLTPAFAEPEPTYTLYHFTASGTGMQDDLDDMSQVVNSFPVDVTVDFRLVYYYDEVGPECSDGDSCGISGDHFYFSIGESGLQVSAAIYFEDPLDGIPTSAEGFRFGDFALSAWPPLFPRDVWADLDHLALVDTTEVPEGTYSSWSWSITPSAVVPEPASWAMMIAGFALAGGTVRRARRTQHPALPGVHGAALA